MLITRGILHRLSPALRESAPQAGDDVVSVSPRFSFVGLPPEPIRVSGITVAATTSVMVHVNHQVIAGVQVVQSVLSISPGYWRIRVAGAYRSNYVVQTNLGGEWRLSVGDGTNTAVVISRYATIAVPTQSIEWTEEFLVRETLTFVSILEANLATQEHTVDYSITGSRLL